jgi:hypothetical protein
LPHWLCSESFSSGPIPVFFRPIPVCYRRAFW